MREFIFPISFQNKYLIYYWYFTLTFCLPFISSYMLFTSTGDDFWVINGVLAAFSLFFFVDSVRFFILHLLGSSAGYIFFKIDPLENTEIISDVGHIGYIYLFLLMVALFFFRKREKEHNEKIEVMQLVGGAMAHEVKSPLATLNMVAQTVEHILEKFTDSAAKNSSHKNISREDYEYLRELGKDLNKVSRQGIETVNSLLTTLKISIIADDKSKYSANECILAALKDFNMHMDHSKKINLKVVNDFTFFGSKHYLKHVIINLLKNSYKYGGSKVTITITVDDNKIYFRDNGVGISSEDIPLIFDRFYTKGRTGTGIGLAFCKMVMDDIHGSIICQSKLGKFTEFTLTFPKI
ncbi:sensor histidine kinase CqsS [Reticulomyxa filosa]|uniref:Sensor histidine kinase CqsS n=1 Tax=Reticulomyxa filosa TaxID=46433 RepID=X6MW83_RETFI|nr:sensor histidine kinase CqsS [Reticulomyxa filosa]|eukprot:ETO18263.1 sensor histidine kinase CqsS [Reticulomyxa filosa]